jgi:hypothetical protein
MKTQISILLILLFISGCDDKSGRKKPSMLASAIKTTNETSHKPIYNIYLENSGSMDGYVKGVTEFEQAVYNFLVDIQNNNLSEKMNLYYINSKFIPNKPDVTDFIEKLEPETFKQKGGNIASTDISQMFKSILAETNNSCVSVFISDCVFSPGEGQNAQQYLVNQQIGIKRNFALKLDQLNLTTVILELSSKFNGNYFDCLNKTTHISAQRPYYIWIIGKHQYIADLFEKVKKESFKGSGIQNFYCAYNSSKSIDYGILNSPKLGYYKRDKSSPKTKIIKAKYSDKGTRKGEFQFSVGIDLKNSFFDDNYLMDANNYIIPSNYSIEVLKNNIKIANYSHILKLTSKSLKTENVNIQLKNNLPQWASNLNSDNDININTSEQLGKTFGIKYLVEGVYEAYKTKNNNKDTFFEINISVNQ